MGDSMKERQSRFSAGKVIGGAVAGMIEAMQSPFTAYVVGLVLGFLIGVGVVAMNQA